MGWFLLTVLYVVIGVVGAGYLTGVRLWGQEQKRKALRSSERLKRFEARYAGVIKTDEYIENALKELQDKRSQHEQSLENAHQELEEEKSQHKQSLKLLEAQIQYAKTERAHAEEELNEAQTLLANASDEVMLINLGYYEPQYDFEFDGHWNAELKKLNQVMREMLRGIKNNPVVGGNAAGFIIQGMSFNNSLQKGRKMQIDTLKLMLRAFNGECSGFVAKVNFKNVELQKKRIEKAWGAINKIGERSNFVAISAQYKDAKTKELNLVFEYEEWKEREKEEQRRIRQQIRDEERAAREIENAQKNAEKEEKQYQEALEKARAEIDGANEKQKEKLQKQIAELEERVGEMEEKKRAISQAMLTKTGHVYIISNVGSFGEDIYKIGMTRRLEPLDRVKELGDASVPFPFDIHAMIRTTDAPTLEKALHNHFQGRRVNLENNRKEFFYVTITELAEELEVLKNELGLEAEFKLTLLAEAKQYRLSEAKRKHIEQP